MPEHLKCVDSSEKFAGAVSHVERYLLADVELPAYFSGVAHPLRMCLSLLRSYLDMTLSMHLAAPAVISHYAVRSIRVDLHVFQREESVQLPLRFAPESGVDHQIRRSPACLLRFRIVPHYNRIVLCKRRVACKEFNIERFQFTCLGILCCH